MKAQRFGSGVEAAYDKWLAAEIQAAIDDPRPNIPHEEVMAEMWAEIAAIVRSKKHPGGGIGKA